MNPNLQEIPIMEYVRRMQREVLQLRAEKGRIDRKQFWLGVLWGAGVTAPVAWYLLHHGG